MKINYLNGMQLVGSKVLTKGYSEIPKKRNKSKRIQKKWNKKYGYNSIPIPDTQLYFFDGKLIGHPVTIKKVLKVINKGGVK